MAGMHVYPMYQVSPWAVKGAVPGELPGKVHKKSLLACKYYDYGLVFWSQRVVMLRTASGMWTLYTSITFCIEVLFVLDWMWLHVHGYELNIHSYICGLRRNHQCMLQVLQSSCPSLHVHAQSYSNCITVIWARSNDTINIADIHTNFLWMRSDL